jgi:hypothetical protein
MATPKKGRKRDYRREYDTYHGTKEQRARRVARDLSRRKVQMKKLGRLKKTGEKGLKGDVHHKDHNPLNKSYANLSLISVYKNRSDNKKSKAKTKTKTKTKAKSRARTKKA